MKLEKKNLIVERPYKSVYKTEEGVVKIFVTDHPKSAVFNEAVYDLSNCPIPDYPNCLETAQSCVHNSSF